ncbi:MAG: hypothetical protein ACP5N1_02075 [Candidatus Woesearchaeota archaeon]
MKYVIDTKEYFDKLLLNHNTKLLPEKFKDKDFNYWYMQSDLTGSIDAYFHFVRIPDKYDLFVSNPSVIFGNNFRTYLVINQFIYYLIRYSNTRKQLLNVFLKEELLKPNPYMGYEMERMDELGEEYIDFDNMLSFYPALKWFYSEETKHLYPKELLRQMKNYEKKLDKLKIEDCFREANKWDRLMKSKFKTTNTKMYLISSRELFNKLLKDYVSNPRLNETTLNTSDLVKTYNRGVLCFYKNDLKSFGKVVYAYSEIMVDSKLRITTHLDIAAPDFYKYVVANQTIYYMLTELKKDTNTILDSIKKIVYSTNADCNVVKDTMRSLKILDDFDKDIMSFYPVLKWYYSKETEHLYSKKLLKQIAEYEKQLNKIDSNDFLKKVLRIHTHVFK